MPPFSEDLKENGGFFHKSSKNYSQKAFYVI